MIDLHCHMLPNLDDGPTNLDTALEMARIAHADGIEVTACTPHIYPGLYPNDAATIEQAVAAFAASLEEAGIPLEVTYGADIQMIPELAQGLRSGRLPTLNGSRYFLFEPPHFSVPFGFARILADTLAAGFVPVITHPERLAWLDHKHYEWFVDAARRGAWIQLTAGALTGRFGRGPRYWSERFLDDGLVHLLATDAHGARRRQPLLAEARAAAAVRVGAEEADRLVRGRPLAVMENREPTAVPPPPAFEVTSTSDRGRRAPVL